MQRDHISHSLIDPMGKNKTKSNPRECIKNSAGARGSGENDLNYLVSKMNAHTSIDLHSKF